MSRKNKLIRRRGTRKNKGGNGKTPKPEFPTKEQLLDKVGQWKKISCLKYKNGSVMIVENNLDTKGITSCSLFNLHSTLNENILYQYIVYHISGRTQILLTPFLTPEIGTKHMCLLMRVPDGALIIGSGEILRRDSTVFYSSMSSLFFQHLKYFLYPTVNPRVRNSSGKRVLDEMIENYEENVLIDFIRQALDGEYRIIFVKDIKSSGSSIGQDGQTIETGPLGKQVLKPEDFCGLPAESRPKCLRYVTHEECEVLERHPGEGYCGAGVDLCDNLHVEDPSEISLPIPEEAYIYQRKIDHTKARAYLEAEGKTPPADKFRTMAMAKSLVKAQGLSPDEIDEKLNTSQLVWPK